MSTIIVKGFGIANDVQAGFRKGRGTWDQIANICWIIEKAKEFQKSTSASLTTLKPLSVWITINLKFLNFKKIPKEMGIPDHLTCLLRNLYAFQEATVRTRHGTTDWFQIGKGVFQGCILSPWLFNFYAENIIRNARLDEAQAGIKFAGRNINKPQICRWHHPYGRKWRGTKEPLDESEGGEWKSWLKAQHSENKDHGIWSHHFMGNKWGNSGNGVRHFFWTPKSLQMVTAAMKWKDTCSVEEKLRPT